MVSLSKINVNNTIEKGRQLCSSMDKYIVDAVEALDIIVDSLIDQSISLCFIGLYFLPTTASSHRQLYVATVSVYHQ
jgi:3-deoxy-D-arabino-heptulosonate 7-phosphate (DAHP) synthase